VLLMTDSQLNVPIGGIIGFGVPGSNKVMEEEAAAAQKQQGGDGGGSGAGASADDIIKQIMGGDDSGSGGGSASPGEEMSLDSPKGSITASGRWIPKSISDSLEKVIKSHANKQRVRSLKPKAKAEAKAKADPKATNTDANAPGFLEQANVSHFCMCFNEHTDGLLGLSTTPPPEHVKNGLLGFGKAHWGVGLNGVSLTKAGPGAAGLLDVKVDGLCTQPEHQSQDSNCGAIIDSGTTAILGPQAHMDQLMESICDNWHHCASEYHRLVAAQKDATAAATKAYGGTDPFKINEVNISKKETFTNVLADCGSLNKGASLFEGDALSDLPTLNFKLCGSDGQCKNIEIPGHMYIIEQDAKDFGGLGSDGAQGPNVIYLDGAPNPLGSAQRAKPLLKALLRGASKVCSPAFDAMEMNTLKNGPAWILGTSVFYQYRVGYGMHDKKISFTPQKDLPCQSPTTEATLGGAPVKRSGPAPEVKIGSLVESPHGQIRPRKIRGPLRRPSFAGLYGQ